MECSAAPGPKIQENSPGYKKARYINDLRVYINVHLCIYVQTM